MNFCFHCGSPLTRLETPNGFIGRYRCDNCLQRYQLTFGDGRCSSDSFHFMGNTPFEIETPETPPVNDIDLGF